MREAFDVLEKAMVVSRVFASASKEMPLVGNLKNSLNSFILISGL
jgi:hypothetical protein